MPLYIASINSGSNGNCYYIGTETEAVLVDAGISCRKVEQRMMRLGLPIKRVKAIFISHEHTDHTKGADVLSRKYQIPVFISEKTYSNSRLNIDPKHLVHFKKGKSVSVGKLKISPFIKSHDAAEPHSFTIHADSLTVGGFTDIGTACSSVTHHLLKCHAAFLESNYDPVMLENGSYPPHLKNRIRSDEGHLSNEQALQLFKNHTAPHLQLLILSHLSEENNRPQLVHDLFSKHARGVEIVVASRHQESDIFCIRQTAGTVNYRNVHPKTRQLSLFD
jgi:phosphoribosyl 1,2-cyclic phosphodiesterase